MPPFPMPGPGRPLAGPRAGDGGGACWELGVWGKGGCLNPPARLKIVRLLSLLTIVPSFVAWQPLHLPPRGRRPLAEGSAAGPAPHRPRARWRRSSAACSRCCRFRYWPPRAPPQTSHPLRHNRTSFRTDPIPNSELFRTPPTTLVSNVQWVKEVGIIGFRFINFLLNDFFGQKGGGGFVPPAVCPRGRCVSRAAGR